jgi:pimeloyl-ACP methyl ester carboxylesterase
MGLAGWILLAVLVAAIASAVALSARYRRDLGRARAALAGASRVAQTALGRIEYGESGDGRPLLSIHGAGGGFDQGLANAAELAGEDFRVVAPSRFGYLRTPIPRDASPAAQADAHAALLEELNIPRAIVLGVSAGARSAVELAIRRPDMVAALILLVPGLYAPESPVAIEASRGSRFAFWAVSVGGDFAWWAAERSTPSVLIRFMGVRPEVYAAAAKAERARVLRIVDSVQPLSLRFPGINVDSAPPADEPPLGRIAAPTLIASARDDLFNTLPAAERAARRIPSAELIVHESGGHLMVGRAESLRAAVRAFLARTQSPRGSG